MVRADFNLIDHAAAIAVVLFAIFCAMELLGARSRAGNAHYLRRMATNFSMPVVAAILAAMAPFSSTAAALWAQDAGFGLFHRVAAPAAVILLVAIAARSLVNYWFHRALHSWPWLWRIHRVHHSDRFFDVTLALRHHPLESLLAIAINAATAAILGLPVWAAVTADLLLLAAGYWEHLDVPAPRWFARFLHPLMTTPDWHRVHHSARRHETDSNFGSLIALWDRLFRTDRPTSRGPVERIGLGTREDQMSDNVWAQLVRPFRP